ELDAQVGLKPKKIRRPAARKLNERGERLCVGADCAAVLTGRAKKCHACKAKEAAIAAQLLAQRQGRGRRTDRERAA
ncbi:MAG: hypothetical protein ACJ8AO_02990, partial [Gemmatimonadaceae bacterium]